ncbi:MAG: hypothetical protein ACR2O1_00510, partial [Boseongicola sp.]
VQTLEIHLLVRLQRTAASSAERSLEAYLLVRLQRTTALSPKRASTGGAANARKFEDCSRMRQK